MHELIMVLIVLQYQQFAVIMLLSDFWETDWQPQQHADCSEAVSD